MSVHGCRVVSQCVESGYSAREAYEAVTQLHDRGETVIQNIRKRAREQREKQDADAPPAAATRTMTPAATGRAGNGKRKAVASAAGASTSAAGSSTATGLPRVTPGHNAPSARPGPSRTSHAPKRTLVERDAVEAAPAIDIGALSAAQLAELQVRIAQQLQVVSS